MSVKYVQSSYLNWMQGYRNQAFSFDTCDRTRTRWHTRKNQTARAICRTRERSSSCVLRPLAFDVKLTTALTLLELENSAGTIDEFFNSYLARFSFFRLTVK